MFSETLVTDTKTESVKTMNIYLVIVRHTSAKIQQINFLSAYASKFLIILLLANMKDHQKPKRKLFQLVDFCFRSRDTNFQSLRNLGKNATRKLDILCPFDKNVTSQVGLKFIQYLNQMSSRRYWSESSKTWYTYEKYERNSKILNILLPWQHSRFEPSLIRNTIISFSKPQWSFSCFWYALVFVDQLLTAIG